MCARPANPELRDKILKAADEIIEDCGPDCVTMREVAEKVGYSATTLYLYFKDKDDVLHEAVLRAFDDINVTCAAVMVGPRAIDKLRQYCRAYVTWGVTHPGHYTLMFSVPWDKEWTSAWRPEDLERVLTGRRAVRRLLREAADAGEMCEPADLNAHSAAGWAALHGSTSLTISGRLLAGAENPTLVQVLEVAHGTADLLVNALLGGADGAK